MVKPSVPLRSIPPPIYIFLGVFALRLIVLSRLADSPFLLPSQGDMHFYNDWAQRILRGEFTDQQAFYGLPLYAYLLAGLYKLFGFSPFVPGFVQACLEGGTAAIVFRLAARVFTPAGSSSAGMASTTSAGGNATARATIIGSLAAFGWAIFVPAQAYSVILMPTAWLIFVFWWIVWQIVDRRTAPHPLWFLCQGLLVGFTAMGIATIFFLIPLILAALLWKWPVEPLRRRWIHVTSATALLFIGIGIGTSPAWLHNHLIARDPVFLSAHSGVNLWIGNNPAANGYPRFPLGLRAGQQAMLKDSITGAEAAAGRPLKRSEVSQFWSAKAKGYIAASPGEWLRLIGRKVANFWNAFQYDDLSIVTSLREQGIILPGIRFGLVAALAVPGIALAWRLYPTSRWVFAAILLHMVALLSVFITERYRLAAVPGLLLFAAFALSQLWESLAAAKYARTALCVGLLFISAAAVSARRGDAELWAVEPYNSGLQALQANRLQDAERKLLLAHAYVRDNAELNFALGNLRLALGEREAARRYYGRTLDLDPLHKGSLNNLGVMALDEKEPQIAAKFFESATALAPDDAKSHYLLARASFEAGEIARARAELQVALHLKPDQPEFLELWQQILARDTPMPTP